MDVYHKKLTGSDGYHKWTDSCKPINFKFFVHGNNNRHLIDVLPARQVIDFDFGAE